MTDININVDLGVDQALLDKLKKQRAESRQQERPFVPKTIADSSVLPNQETRAGSTGFSTNIYTSNQSLSRNRDTTGIVPVATSSFSRQTFTQAYNQAQVRTVDAQGRKRYYDPELRIWVDEPNRLIVRSDTALEHVWYWGLLTVSDNPEEQVTDISGPFYFESGVGVDAETPARAFTTSESEDNKPVGLQPSEIVLPYLNTATTVLLAPDSSEIERHHLSVSSESSSALALPSLVFFCEIDIFLPQFNPIVYNTDTDRLASNTFFSVNFYVDKLDFSAGGLGLQFSQTETVEDLENPEPTTTQESSFSVSMSGLQGLTLDDNSFVNENGIFANGTSMPPFATDMWHRIGLGYDGFFASLLVNGSRVASIKTPRVVGQGNGTGTSSPIGDDQLMFLSIAFDASIDKFLRPQQPGDLACGQMAILTGSAVTSSYTPQILVAKPSE